MTKPALSEEIYLDQRMIQLKDLATKKELENLKPVVLYNNTSGTQGSITLSDSVENYTKIEILARLGDREIFVKTIYKEQMSYGSDIEIPIAEFWHDGTSGAGIFGSFYKLSGKKLTYSTSMRFYSYSGQGAILNATNSIYIHKILGYR